MKELLLFTSSSSILFIDSCHSLASLHHRWGVASALDEKIGLSTSM